MESQNIMELEALTPTEMDAGLVFSGVPTGNTIWGFQNPCLYTPAIDPHYSFHESARDAAVWFMNKLDPLYLYGPTGSGKTSLIKQLAARLNYPIFEVTGRGRLEFADLCGHISLHEGSMRYEYGPLSLAMRYGGLFLINEVDLLHQRLLWGSTEFWKVRRCACRKTVGKSFIRMKCSVSPARATPTEEVMIPGCIRELAE